MHPTLDKEEGMTVVKLTSLGARVSPWRKDDLTNDATKEKSPHCIHKLISHPDMTQLWVTQPQDIAY